MNSELLSNFQAFGPVLANVPNALFDSNIVTVSDEMKKQNQEFEMKYSIKKGENVNTLSSSSSNNNVLWNQKKSHVQDSPSQWGRFKEPQGSRTSNEKLTMIPLIDVENIVKTYERAIALYQKECEQSDLQIEKLKKQISILKSKFL